jgi:hypothetical protein
MRDIHFRVWHRKDKKMYFRGYQKLSHVLLCEDDKGTNDGKGKPVKKASYDDCDFLETTSLFDKNGAEIFEGDIVKIRTARKVIKGTAGEVPDMFRSRGLHPLQDLLQEHGLMADDILEIEVVGNRYESHV